MKNWKDNVHFILVQPKEPGNIGASARAIKNMGFRNLEIVRPAAEIDEEARWFAHNAGDVLASALLYDTFREAIADKSIVIGTTRRRGKRRGVIVSADAGARQAFAIARSNRVAVVFGREDRGLLNSEVDECGLLVTVPAAGEQPSLNLSQAVLIVAYELLKAGHAAQSGLGDEESPAGAPRQWPVSIAQAPEVNSSGQVTLVAREELTRFFERLASTLKLLDYIPRGNKDIERKIMQNLRHFFARSGLTEWELKMLRGIMSQIEKKMGKERL